MGKDHITCVVAESYLTPIQKTILLVEDNPTLSRIMQRTIENCTPYRVVHLFDGAAILEVLKEYQPDLLMLDYDLPGKNGIALYDLVHANPGCEHIPTIIISAELPERQIAQRSLLCLSKPYRTSVLLEMLEGVLV